MLPAMSGLLGVLFVLLRAVWAWRQLVEATSWGRAPRFPLRAAGLGITTVLTPAWAPRANAVAERLVGTLRRECFDHLIVVNERHPKAVLGKVAGFYKAARRHRTLELETPQPASRPGHGPIRASPVSRRAPPLLQTRGVGRYRVLPPDRRIGGLVVDR